MSAASGRPPKGWETPRYARVRVLRDIIAEGQDLRAGDVAELRVDMAEPLAAAGAVEVIPPEGAQH